MEMTFRFLHVFLRGPSIQKGNPVYAADLSACPAWNGLRDHPLPGRPLGWDPVACKRSRLPGREPRLPSRARESSGPGRAGSSERWPCLSSRCPRPAPEQRAGAPTPPPGLASLRQSRPQVQAARFAGGPRREQAEGLLHAPQHLGRGRPPRSYPGTRASRLCREATSPGGSLLLSANGGDTAGMKAPVPRQGTSVVPRRSHWVARTSSRRTGDPPPWRTAAARDRRVVGN